QSRKSIGGFEGAIFVGGLRPRDVGGVGNVTGALRGFRHSRRSDNFSGEFVDRAHVHKLAALLALRDRQYVLFESAHRLVRAGDAVGRWRNLRGVLGQRALLFQPLLASAVDQLHILVPLILQLPEGVGREPVVVVTVEQDGRIIGDSRLTQQLF